MARVKGKGKLIYEPYSRVIVITKIRESFPEKMKFELVFKERVEVTQINRINKNISSRGNSMSKDLW